MQTKVAIVYPKIPESMLGMKYARHPLATHMAAAVVGPPTFALLASTISFLEYPNSFPAASTMPRWTKTCRRQNAKRRGARETTLWMEPLQPTVAKKNCMIRRATPSPAPEKDWSLLGAMVANATVIRVARGMSVPGLPTTRLASAELTRQTTEEKATARPASYTLILASPPPSSAASACCEASAAPCSGPTFLLSQKIAMKYRAHIRLSAARAAATVSPVTSSVWLTAM
mmetsp:Transcript_1242/g.4703  ORF Transcript_1242/g.4703 Transcript_1242/m.4703 type:complete len:230 (+) Transcript_1242:156-845(+)